MGGHWNQQRRNSTASGMAPFMSRIGNSSHQSYLSNTTDSSETKYSYVSSPASTSPESGGYGHSAFQIPYTVEEGHYHSLYSANPTYTQFESYENDLETTGGWSQQGQPLTGNYPSKLPEIEEMPYQQVDSNFRWTTSDLKWTGHIHQMASYDFRPVNGELLPLFVLKKGVQPSLHVPQNVYLNDQERRSQKDKTFECQFPSLGGLCCLKKGQLAVFRRQPDLLRHYMTVHVAPEFREQIFCDYETCNRAAGGDPISRKDHQREHYREYHLEDLPLPKLKKLTRKELESWWSSRDLKTAKWRCSGCLHRNKETDGWNCGNGKCQKPCEDERIIRREQAMSTRDRSIIGTGARLIPQEVTHINDMSFNIPCSVCQGHGYFEGSDHPCQMCQGTGSGNYLDYGEQSSTVYRHSY